MKYTRYKYAVHIVYEHDSITLLSCTQHTLVQATSHVALHRPGEFICRLRKTKQEPPTVSLRRNTEMLLESRSQQPLHPHVHTSWTFPPVICTGHTTLQNLFSLACVRVWCEAVCVCVWRGCETPVGSSNQSLSAAILRRKHPIPSELGS